MIVIDLILAAVLGGNEDALERARSAAAGLPGLAAWKEQAGAPAQPAAKKFEDYKRLLENNIFSPPKPKKPDPPPPKPPAEKKPDPPKPPDPVLVTGFVFNEVDRRWEAVIEDKKKKETRFLKAGDAVEGWTILSIEQERMKVKRGEKDEHEFVPGDSINGTALATEKEMLGEAAIDPKKVEEARHRMREARREKKGMVEDEVEEPAIEKKNKKGP